jgi:hypothetical protein
MFLVCPVTVKFGAFRQFWPIRACRATIKLRKRVNQDEKPCALAA